MRKNLLKLLLIGCMALVITGCNRDISTDSNGETKNPLDEFLDLDPAITDSVIAGQAVNEIGSLYDITKVLELENYKILDCHPYSEDKIMVLYSGKNGALVKICDITNGKSVKEIKLDKVILSEGADLNVVSEDFAYVQEFSGKMLIYINVKVGESTKIFMDKNPETLIMPGEGDAFYYTLKDDCNIYQYIADNANSFSAFDATGMVDSISLEYVVQGGNTLIVYVESEGYTGYAMLSLEMQELSPLEIIEGEFYYDGTEYVYSAMNDSPVLYIYNPMTPRLAIEFKLDYLEETKDVRLCKFSTCFLTLREDNENSYIRYYSFTEGVLKNEVILENTKINGTFDFENSNIILINADEKIYIWNTEIIENVLE